MGIWSVKVIEGSILSGRARTGSATTLKDDAKNMETDAFKEKFIKIILNGVEYVRKILSNTADTFTFGTIGTAAAAKAVIDNTAAGGGKVTISADPTGAYANDYTVETVKGEGESAETEASFADDVLTITLGTGAGVHAEAVIGTESVNQILIQAKVAEPIEGYSIDVQTQSGNDLPLAVGMNLDTGLITISLGTDENGDPDDTENTVANIVNALNANIQFTALFTASSNYGAGVHDVVIAPVNIEGGVSPVVDATAADIKTAIESLEGAPFTVVADAVGVIDVLANPVLFAGGLDEVKPVDRTEYFVI
jgi:hypothetical protein